MLNVIGVIRTKIIVCSVKMVWIGLKTYLVTVYKGIMTIMALHQTVISVIKHVILGNWFLLYIKLFIY